MTDVRARALAILAVALVLAAWTSAPARADEPTPGIERATVPISEAKTRTERWLDLDPPAVIGYDEGGYARRRRSSLPCARPCAKPCRTPCPKPKRNRCCDYADWDNRCDWSGHVALAVWLPGMHGTLGAGPANVDVDVSAGDLIANLGDVLEKLEFILQGAVGVQRGRWGLDFIFSGLEFGETIPLTFQGTNIPADASAKIFQGQLNLRYRVGKTRLGRGLCPQLLVYEPYVGVRGYNADIRIALPRGLGPDLGSTWFDPVVGGRITWDLRNRFAVIGEGDVGGFGVGSDLSWKGKLAVSWRFARRWHLSLGWVWLKADYESGTGLNRFKWDLLQSGPLLAIAFRF